MSSENSTILPLPFENFKDINFGIILLTLYILFDFGTFQGVFEIVNTLRLPYIVAVLSVGYALYLVVSKRINFNSSTTKIFILLCIYIIIYSQISTLDFQQKEATLTLFLQYLANYIIFVSCVKTLYHFIFLLDIWLFGILHSSFHAIYQGGKLWDSIWLRDENTVALVCAYAVPVAFFLYVNYESKIKKICYATCIGFYVTGVIVSVSRGGIVTLIVMGVFCWIFVKRKIMMLMWILLATFLVILYAPPTFFVEFKTLEQGTKEGTADERVYSWGLALMMFKDYPILGVGPHNYPEHFQEYDYEERYGIKRGRKAFAKRVAHSTPFQWLAEFGIIGSIPLIMLQITMFRNWKAVCLYKKMEFNSALEKDYLNIFKMLTNGCALSQLGFWIAALFLSEMIQPFYWILIPFSEVCKNISLDYIYQEQRNEESPLLNYE